MKWNFPISLSQMLCISLLPILHFNRKTLSRYTNFVIWSLLFQILHRNKKGWCKRFAWCYNKSKVDKHNFSVNPGKPFSSRILCSKYTELLLFDHQCMLYVSILTLVIFPVSMLPYLWFASAWNVCCQLAEMNVWIYDSGFIINVG